MFGDGKTGLNYLGNDTAVYQKSYTLKGSKQKNPWGDLIKVTEILNNTPINDLENSISKYMDIDRTLWMLACEDVFVDDDGYVFKGGMDYYLYDEPETGRLVTIQYDGNATMMAEKIDVSPFLNEDRENFPLMNRVLKVPSLRQRYLAHMRTIIEETLTPEKVNPLIDEYSALIDSAVKADTKKLYSTKEFHEGIPELKKFVTERRAFLLSNEEVGQKGVSIGKVSLESKKTRMVTVEMNKTDNIKQVNLWFSTGIVGQFRKIVMSDSGSKGDAIKADGVYSTILPKTKKGKVVRYYIEAISGNKAGTATYSPAGAEHDVYILKPD